MCIHKYFIFKQCGHSYFAPAILVPCASRVAQDEARCTTPKKKKSTGRSRSNTSAAPPPTRCIPTAHPYRTFLIHTGLCLHCEIRRAQGLALAERNIQVATFPERKWRVRYSVPQKSGLEGAFPEGGWANGSDLDVNGFIRREEEARKSKEAAEMRQSGSGGEVKESGSPLSASSWKTSHRHMSNEMERRTGSIGGRLLNGGRI